MFFCQKSIRQGWERRGRERRGKGQNQRAIHPSIITGTPVGPHRTTRDHHRTSRDYHQTTNHRTHQTNSKEGGGREEGGGRGKIKTKNPAGALRAPFIT